MSGLKLLLQSLDGALRADEESLARALQGISPAEAGWQPPGYPSSHPLLPSAGTGLWHIVHLAHSARHYAEILRTRSVESEPQTPPPSFDDLAALLAEVESSHEALRREVAGLRESDLARPCARGVTVEQFILMAVRHITWHSGQIVVVRRLARAATAEP